MLGEFVGTILQLLDIDANVVSWVTLILNVESQMLQTANLSVLKSYRPNDIRLCGNPRELQIEKVPPKALSIWAYNVILG